MAGDFVLLNILLYVLGTELPKDIIPDYFKMNPKIIVLAANFALVISEYFFHTIIHHRRVTFTAITMRVCKLVICQSLIMFVFLRFMSDGGRFFEMMVIFTVVYLVLILFTRLIERIVLRTYRKKGGNTRSIVFIGNDPANLMLYREMTDDPTTGYIIKGYYSNGFIEDCPPEFEKLGTISDLDKEIGLNYSFFSNEKEKKTITEESDFQLNLVDEIFCCLSHDDSEFISRIMKFCDNHIIHFHYVPRMYGNVLLNLKPERFGKFSLFTNLREPLTYMSNKFIKRTFDIIFSSIVCLCMLPFIPIIALIIKWQSPGPMFFKQARTGLNGKTFMCYKFRSMHVNKDADKIQATADDPRKFSFGNLMRKTNLDEFPQFFNVLKGDMSIVGPRPHMLLHTEMYRKVIDKYMVRHFSRPGITGYAQVTGFRGETKEQWQMEERVKRDIWYIENWTFGLDLKIIFLTFKSIFINDKNAY